MTPFSPYLDEISENIIYMLSLDSRLKITELSKKIGINRRIVENRVHMLFKKGFIKPILIYNYPSLIKATVLVKLSKFDETTINLLIDMKKFVKVKETLGQYDISFFLIAQNQKEYDLLLNLINKTFHNLIQNMDVIIHDKEDTLGYKKFCHEEEFLRYYKPLEYDNLYRLTDDEHAVMAVLKEKPSFSYKELMGITGFNFKKVKNIITSLIDNGIIRFTIDPSYQLLGLEFHNVLVKINLAKRKEFERYCVANPSIHWLKRGSGTWNYILSVASRNINEFIEITRDIRSKNKDTIINSTTLISNIHIMRKF